MSTEPEAPPPSAEPTAAVDTPAADDVAKTAGRGFLVITAAKLWFMVGGAAISFGLSYVFSSRLYPPGTDGAALYGQYTDLNNTFSILSMVMITGVMQSVSRFVTQSPERLGGVVRQALKLMLVVGAILGGGFIALSPWLSRFRQDADVVNGYRLAGVVLFCYGLYSVFIAVLNGRKLFLPQALFDITATSLRALFMLGLAALGLGVSGAFGGFALAAATLVVLAGLRVRREIKPGEPAPGFVLFALQVMLYTFVFNLVFKLDVWLLKPAAQAVLAGLPAAQLDVAVDRLVGQYGMALNIARLPWQATLAITLVIFPLMSEVTFARDKARAGLYTRQALRYAMLLAGAAAVVLAAVPEAVVNLLPKDLAPAALALAWLGPAYFIFSLFNIINTLLTSAGRATTVLAIGVVTVGAAAVMYYFVLPRAADAAGLLRMAGLLTLAAFTLGLVLGTAALWKEYGPPFPLGTTVRVVTIGAALIAVGRFLPAMGKVGSLAVAVALGIAFLAALVVTKEFGPEDKARFQRVVRRKKA